MPTVQGNSHAYRLCQVGHGALFVRHFNIYVKYNQLDSGFLWRIGVTYEARCGHDSIHTSYRLLVSGHYQR